MKKLILSLALMPALLIACSKDDKKEPKKEVLPALWTLFAKPSATITVTDMQGTPIDQAQVLIGEHFPRLVDLFTPLMRRQGYARGQRKVPGNALIAPGDDGRERSGDESPRETSLYTGAALHPAAVAGAALTLGALLAVGLGWRRKKA